MMIHWCEICNAAPAEGVLEVIYSGETQISRIMSCTSCVEKIDDSDWIENIDLQQGVQP
jgi:hypothetical protein